MKRDSDGNLVLETEYEIETFLNAIEKSKSKDCNSDAQEYNGNLSNDYLDYKFNIEDGILKSKFKIGDEVIVVNCINNGGNKEGVIFTIGDIEISGGVNNYEKIIYHPTDISMDGCYEPELELYRIKD